MALPQASSGTAEDVARSNIPTAVRTFMASRGISRATVMAATGMSKQTLSERLAGKSPWKDYEIISLAWLFEVEPGVLFLPPGELLRNRCFSIVPVENHQMELSFLPDPNLTSV